MTPQDRIDEARVAWARGDARRAVAQGWDAVNTAMDRGADAILMQARDLALAIAEATEGRSQADARRLYDYCRHCLAGVGTGTQAPSLFALITGWRRRKCPDCAESIAREARVCPHCGYRLAPPPTAPSA